MPTRQIQPTQKAARLICDVHGGFAAVNRGADFVQHLAPALAPEQGAGPDTVKRTIKLRLLARPTVPVSTAIRRSISNRKLIISMEIKCLK